MSATPKPTAAVQAALEVVGEAGWVSVREGSYRRSQERQRRAEALQAASDREAEKALRWARNCLSEERRLRDRLTFVYGVARAHGATVEELSANLDGTKWVDAS